MRKKLISLLITFFVIMSLFSFFTFISVSGSYSGRIQCIAINSDGDLFLGLGNKIKVYNHGKETRVLRITERSPYRFYIEDEKIIFAVHGEKAKEYDFNFNSLGRATYYYGDVERVADANRTIIYSGDLYELSNDNSLRPAKLRYNGDVIYQEGIPDVLFSGIPFAGILILCFLSLSFFVLRFLTDEETLSYIRQIHF